MMENQGGTKEKEVNIDMREGVRMDLSILDCPICYEPLIAPIFQCGVGHVLCPTCNIMLDKCPQCSGTVFQRCFIMERVVESVVSPCSFSKHGCVEQITCFNKKKHEKECLHRPCFCPDSGCSFTGTTVPLLVHFTIHHKWPSKKFNYYKPFDLPIKPGPSPLLNAQDDHLFLMNIEPLEPLGHAVSLVCVQPDGRESRYRCSVEFSCFEGHNQTSTLEVVKSSSLLDGLPKEYFCIMPHASDSSPVMLRTTIDTELVYDEADNELEDESYDEDDEADSSDDD